MKTARAILPILLAAAMAVIAAAPAAAQAPLKSFDQLNTWLRPGDTVWVTDAQGREVKGKLWGLAPDTLTLGDSGKRAFAARDVSLIRTRRPDSLRNGALIGLGVGGGLTLAACLAQDNGGEPGWCLLVAAAYAGIGAGIGVGIDALIPGEKLVVYRAPGSPDPPPARLSVTPIVTPRAKGVALSFAF